LSARRASPLPHSPGAAITSAMLDRRQIVGGALAAAVPGVATGEGREKYGLFGRINAASARRRADRRTAARR